MPPADGLSLCSRYAYPPNSLSLCGPDKRGDLLHYSSTFIFDKGTKEILEDFSTLYPYLCLIAYENNIKDPFDNRVSEAYWLGNKLLESVGIKNYAKHLKEKLQLRKKSKKEQHHIFKYFSRQPLPHHSFQVMSTGKRMGHLEIPHTLESMDACLINWGRILAIGKQTAEIETQKLETIKGILTLSKKKFRTVRSQGDNDRIMSRLIIGDYVSYHWGYICQRLTLRQLKNLQLYTYHSLKIINT